MTCDRFQHAPRVVVASSRTGRIVVGLFAAEILRRVGWARSVAGVGPYLTKFSRGLWRRAEVDAEVEALRILELPSARGCT
jgi:hypothetical protein